MPGFFSDIFGVPTQTLDDYGALDVSLIADLPLFVDPFLLFNSDKPEYQALHEQIVTYLKFLRDKSEGGRVSDGLLKEWYCFKEIKQNWLGYCELGNDGSGLGLDFAKSLNSSLHLLFQDFGKEKVTKGTHLEKVCIIKDGVGRDNISDFATNLIKKFLLDYTQQFALEHLSEGQRKSRLIERASFNYTLEKWVAARYTLPFHNGDHVILTPKDILTKDENWINQNDLVEKFDDISASIPDQQLRWTISNYFYKRLEHDEDKDPTKKQRREAALEVLREYPSLVDFYIKLKEESGNEATSVNEEKLLFVQLLFNEAVRKLTGLLPEEFYQIPALGTYEEAHRRLAYLKHVIEDQGGHRWFFAAGKPIRREKDLHVLYRLVWYGTKHDFGAEADDGRGPVDFKISYGAKDKSLVEFKLASNTQLKHNLNKQLELYQNASDAQHGIKAIIYFSDEELDRVNGILTDLGLTGHKDVVLIDARADNKPSGSKAK